ncbi:S-layer homology domain-containing protein [Anaerotignum lactatifermentans]|uniref:S-layer homology domain-containing protein n=1 Tax=Anaerotignum lactatifermentans TaxID=160404 RepID=UPI003AF0C674
MKKRTGKMISLSLAVAMAVTAAPVTALADENTQSNVIEASELTTAQNAGETGTDTTTEGDETGTGTTTEGDETEAGKEVTSMEPLTSATPVDEQSTETTLKSTGTVGTAEDLTNALETAANNEKTTITLSDNIEGDFTVAENKNIVLDLNGFKITNTSNHTITNNGRLTIKDSSEGKTGIIDNVTHARAAVWNNGIAILEGGTYTRSLENGIDEGNSGGNSYYNIVNHNHMTIKSGVTVEQDGNFSSMIENGWYNGNQNTAETPSIMIIEGGTFSGGLNTIKNDDYGELTINDGEFTNVSQAVFLNWNVAEVNGGTFAVENNAQSVILNGYLNGTMDQGQLTIHNGTFTANESGAFIKTMGGSKTTGEIEINGGDITGDIVLSDATDGATVTVADGVTINGNVQNGGLTDVTVTGATINGNLANNGTGSISVTDTNVSGNVSNSQNGKMAIIGSDVGSYTNENNNITFIDSTQNGEEIQNTAEGSVAMTGASPYSSLGAAITDVQAGGIIYILQDVPDAAGITVSSHKQFTVDFGGHTYTLKDPGAGSSGTETNGFQLLKDSTITFKNGTIRIAKETTSIKRIIQNYANLTLEDMHFYAENQADGQDYPLSFNNGIITFKGDTDIITPYDNNIAFDVCQFNNYPKVTVTFDESYTGTINGRIVYDSPNADTHQLYIKGNGTFGSIECTDKSNSAAKKGIEVTSGNFAESVNKDYLADAVKAQLESHSNTKAPFSYYTSLKDALNAAKPGDNVTEVNPDNSKAQYTVTLKYNDGTTPDSAYRVSAGTTITLPTPSRSHYSFEGWYNGNNLVESPYTVAEDVELTAKWHRTSSHRYDGYITIINPKNGDVSVSDSWADEDDKITLTITPDKGYEVDKIEIVDDEGDKIDAKKVDDEDNKYTFRMANCDVTVTVTFKEEGKTTEDTDKEEDKDDEETTETTELNFTDVKESDWFYKGVAYVVDKGIMSGVSENQFDPSGKLTRAMLVQMLYNMESRPACDAENAFMDVPVGQWYTDAVIWANDAKIVSGMGEGLFAPNMEITREQMVAMLYNYAKYKGYDVTASADLSAFADTASVSAWAQPAMQWAVAEGYISGMGDSQLAPQGTATRAEIASVIMRFMEATAETAE